MTPDRPGEPSPGPGAIVEALQAGDRREESYRRLFDLYYRRVSRFFAKRGLATEDCLDLTQETFLAIFRGLGSLRGEAKFEAWIFKIATNLYRKRLRWGGAAKRTATVIAFDGGGKLEPAARGPAPEELPAGDRGPDRRVLDQERSRQLRAVIAALPDQMRKCLILRVYHDLKYREIAAVMRLSIETVKAHLAQARLRLRESLGGPDQDLDL